MKRIPCPHCHHMLNAGQLLGKMAAGKPRRFSPEILEKLKSNLVKARAKIAEIRESQRVEDWSQLQDRP